MDFTFTKDEATGAITIKYTSPKELPLRFSWTATIDVNGKMTRTQPAVETPRGNIDEADAKNDLRVAAKKRGIVLDKATLDVVWSLYALHAEKMYSDDAKNFADFIVNLTKSGAARDQWDALVEKIVKNIDALRP